MISLKKGVSLCGLKAEILMAAIIVKSVYEKHGYNCVVTSGTDGKHGRGSHHYKGLALDFRTRNISNPSVIYSGVKNALGPEFDIVLHSGSNQHLHVEYDPKSGGI